MKVPFMRFVSKVNAYRADRAESILKSHVNINDYNIYSNSLEQILAARTCLGNYAKKNNVFIDIFRGDRALADGTRSDKREELFDKILVRVTDKKSKRHLSNLIDADTNRTYEHKILNYWVEETSDETQIVHMYEQQSHEDDFIRNLYRKISEMVKEIRQEKK